MNAFGKKSPTGESPDGPDKLLEQKPLELLPVTEEELKAQLRPPKERRPR